MYSETLQIGLLSRGPAISGSNHNRECPTYQAKELEFLSLTSTGEPLEAAVMRTQLEAAGGPFE